MRPFRKNNHADVSMILTALVLAITLAIGVIVIWNVLGAVETDDVDDTLAENVYSETTATTIRPAYNASLDVEGNLETFYTIAPIMLIVVAAVGILGYVLLLRRRG